MAPRLRVALWVVGSVYLVLATAFISNPVLTGTRDSWCVRQLPPDGAETTSWEHVRLRGRRRALSSASRSRDGTASDKEEELTRHGVVGVGIRKVSAAIAAAVVAFAPDSALGASRAQVSTEPEITAKCFIEIRIMEPLNAANNYSSANAYRGKLVFGLYGKASPKAVENFERYVMADQMRDQPSYAGGVMTKMEPGVIIEGGKIGGLNPINIGGREELEFRGDVIESPLILEDGSDELKHNKRGLLTRSRLSIGPEFAVTLGPVPDLDGTHEVFGRLLKGEDVLRRLERVPVYSLGSSRLQEGSFADKAYRAQKRAFLYLGKNVFKDTRAVDRTGSFMRRIDILSCGPA